MDAVFRPSLIVASAQPAPRRRYVNRIIEGELRSLV
jgi:hypothetical protein